jgi:hypothetical protein
MVVTKVRRSYEGVAGQSGLQRIGQLPKAPGGRIVIHPAAAAVQQDGPIWAVADGIVDSPANGGWQWDQDDLANFAAYPQHPVACSET